MLCVAIGIHIHVLCTHGHTCTSYACMCSYKVQLFPLVHILQAASDKKPLVSQGDSSHHGSHIVGREETQFVV